MGQGSRVQRALQAMRLLPPVTFVSAQGSGNDEIMSTS